MKDPADQFKWTDQVLTEAAKYKEKVTLCFILNTSYEESVNNASLYCIMLI